MMAHPIRLLSVVTVAVLAGCASPPTQTSNACSIFAEKSGFLTSWRSDAERVSRTYGVPVSVLMATIQAESNFEARARPPRRTILGFIPGRRISTAYGYAQALDGTWADYQNNTGRHSARRNSFGSAIEFIGWYHADSSRRHGIARNDAYRLYLAYHSGHAGYRRGAYQNRPEALRGARRAAEMAARYESQLRGC
jgi:hypothetical protein